MYLWRLGSAGGGKSFGLLLTPLAYRNVPGFGYTVFRRNYNQIFAQGGLWDESLKMYSGIRGAHPRPSRGEWVFSGKDGKVRSKVSFAHIERDVELSKWQGSQICGIGFDELTHFSRKAFIYMLSRNRSTCGVRPFVRATCNPDADSWVADFISWWINQETGYAIPERSGAVRWMLNRDDTFYWADTPEELWEQFDLKTEEERQEPKSVTLAKPKKAAKRADGATLNPEDFQKAIDAYKARRAERMQQKDSETETAATPAAEDVSRGDKIQ